MSFPLKKWKRKKRKKEEGLGAPSPPLPPTGQISTCCEGISAASEISKSVSRGRTRGVHAEQCAGADQAPEPDRRRAACLGGVEGRGGRSLAGPGAPRRSVRAGPPSRGLPTASPESSPASGRRPPSPRARPLVEGVSGQGLPVATRARGGGLAEGQVGLHGKHGTRLPGTPQRRGGASSWGQHRRPPPLGLVLGTPQRTQVPRPGRTLSAPRGGRGAHRVTSARSAGRRTSGRTSHALAARSAPSSVSGVRRPPRCPWSCWSTRRPWCRGWECQGPGGGPKTPDLAGLRGVFVLLSEAAARCCVLGGLGGSSTLLSRRAVSWYERTGSDSLMCWASSRPFGQISRCTSLARETIGSLRCPVTPRPLGWPGQLLQALSQFGLPAQILGLHNKFDTWLTVELHQLGMGVLRGGRLHQELVNSYQAYYVPARYVLKGFIIKIIPWLASGTGSLSLQECS